jgi:IMP cyclohydrolase
MKAWTLVFHIEIKDETVMSEYEAKNRPWTEYNGLRTVHGGKAVIVSNGEQTDAIARLAKYCFGADKLKALEYSLLALGPERDSPVFTPRVACSWEDEYGYLAIINQKMLELGQVSGGELVHPKSGRMLFVSTYAGGKGNDIVIPDSPGVPTGEMDLAGDNAQAIADGFFASLPPEWRVCTVAALWNPDKKMFEVACRNLHQ